MKQPKTRPPAEVCPTGFLRINDVLRLLPLSASTFRRGIKAGAYPAPVQLTQRTVAWKGKDIIDLLLKLSGEKSFNER